MSNATDGLKQRQINLIPDYIDVDTSIGDPSSFNPDEKILASFHDLKRKTLQSLYGLDKNKTYDHALLKDKSPKGSVDDGMLSLVDLINAHPSFATLSSCSGRISLFDPNHEATLQLNAMQQEQTMDGDDDGNGEVDDEVDENGTTGDIDVDKDIDKDIDIEIESDRAAKTTGKGYGAWLITSHARITASNLISALDQQAKSNSHHALIFKHEPLLLHVAASNLSRARQLLKIALDLGFRESGTVITPKKITVAIRSHSLALTAPIASKGRLRPNQEYMEELVREANERFILNEVKLKRLEKMVEQTLFTVQEDIDVSLDRVDCTLEEFPGLNLWGHTAVTILNGNEDGDVDVLAIGGHGTGPNGKKKSSSRSNKIYNLQRTGGQWHDAWSEVKINQSNLDEETTIEGFHAKRVALTAREGCASCILPLPMQQSQLGSPLIAIFGGRASPARPNNELLLLSYASSGEGGLYSPMDMRGEIPQPRWGHSFTALSGEGGRLAVVIGGRNENSLESTMHILSIGSEFNAEGAQSLHLKWEKLPQTISRFHHCVSRISKQKESSNLDMETIIVQGGLSSIDLITEAGTEEYLPFLAVSLRNDELACSIHNCSEATSSGVFGGSMCALSSFNESILFSSGGLACDAMQNDTNHNITVMKYCIESDNSSPSLQILPNTIQEASNNSIHFGSLVHHSCIELPSSTTGVAEVILVGGGVPTFAFGQAFANSYLVTIRPQGGKAGTASTHIAHQKRMNRNKPPMQCKKPNGSRKGEADVIFVHKRYAKEVKTALEGLSMLDRNYRMVKADISAPVDDPLACIAVPVSRDVLELVSGQGHRNADHPWLAFVMGSGTQVVPFSSVVLGRKG
jgi:tRNA wybutosine-synthesizing protein 3